MLRRAIVEAKRMFGLHSPGRNLAVFPDDTFLVSFPKSGNTWARFLIANLVRPNETIDFSNVNSVIPGPEVTRNRDLMRIPRPRIIKSHQYFDPRYKQVIYIVRDPRDVVVSQYHFQRKRKIVADGFPLSDFVSKFLAGETCFYGSWGEHVGSWLATRRGQPGFLLLRYEDMVSDSARELARVASFLGRACTNEEIDQAVQRSSADTMRQLEKSQSQLFTSTKDTRKDIPFVRAAKAGGWRTALSEESAARIEEAWGHLISWLGYEALNGGMQAGNSSERNQQADFLVGPRS
ncbi:MAG: sulfotransferase [Acidobacteria bacterium]|nr:MAG: sulfotransferase [Acidobacteriota bacterium]